MKRLSPILFGVLMALSAGCQRDGSVTRLSGATAVDAGSNGHEIPANFAEKFNPRLLRRFAPIRRVIGSQDLNRIRLGRLLYFEPLLSRTGQQSCNYCHPLDRYGTTAVRFATGVDGHAARRNTPSVYNVEGQFAQFWDGRAHTLVEQVELHLQDHALIDMGADRAVSALSAIPGYRSAFAEAFPGPADSLTARNIAIAIAQFERGLITPSRWDLYLDGDSTALSEEEQEGARLFANLGCIVCHTGAYVGGTTFEKVGRVVPWPNRSDRGRYDLTRDPADDMVFKVPSLRNIARTGPYFHDGSAATLNAAVQMMAEHQLGMYPTAREVDAIVAWLGSMTGDLPRDYIATPILPAAARLQAR